MKKNRKQPKKMSVTATHSVRMLAAGIMIVIMVIVNLLASSHCGQIMKQIGEKEELLVRLEKERERESGRWDQLKLDENLEHALRQLGMQMKYARAEQVVRMNALGEPEPGQLSVRRDARRRQMKPVASNREISTARRRR